MNRVNNLVRVLVFGTFDILHPGHRDMFRQARALADNVKLIVSVARDKNVVRIKGRAPRHDEHARLERVKALPEVSRATLGGIREHMPHIIRLNPDIIALGYDQKAYVAGLRQELRAAGLKTKVVRLNPFHPEKFKSSFMNHKVSD